MEYEIDGYASLEALEREGERIQKANREKRLHLYIDKHDEFLNLTDALMFFVDHALQLAKEIRRLQKETGLERL